MNNGAKQTSEYCLRMVAYPSALDMMTCACSFTVFNHCMPVADPIEKIDQETEDPVMRSGTLFCMMQVSIYLPSVYLDVSLITTEVFQL